jgi:hypothetical protein
VAYTQTVVDNFNDNSIGTGVWTVNEPTGLTETSGQLHMACVSGYPEIEWNVATSVYDLRNGIIGIKVSKSGTFTNQSELYFGVDDTAGNIVGAWFGGDSSTTWDKFRNVTFSSAVTTDTGGLGSGWTNGTWIGIGNLGVSDSVLRIYKSSDGQTWTEMTRATIGGTHYYTEAAGMFMTAGVWSGSSSGVWDLDDASWFLNTGGGGSTQYTKVRVGGAWVNARPKVRVGGAWVDTHPKVREGGLWVPTY